MTDKPVQEQHIDTENREYDFVNHQAGTVYMLGLAVIATLALLATKMWQFPSMSWWWVAAPGLYVHARQFLFRVMRNAFHAALIAERQMFEEPTVQHEITMDSELVDQLDPSLVNIYALDQQGKNPTE